MLCVGFVFGQTQNLEVTNLTGQPMLIWAAAADTTCGNDQTASTPVLVQPNATAVIAPLAGPNGFWVGFKTTAALGFPGGGISGAFYNPCQPCGVDFSNGVSIQWDQQGGCFRARIF